LKSPSQARGISKSTDRVQLYTGGDPHEIWIEIILNIAWPLCSFWLIVLLLLPVISLSDDLRMNSKLHYAYSF
jgi:hypothetical protein